MGSTLSCDSCDCNVRCQTKETSEFVYTLKRDTGDTHVCIRCFEENPRMYDMYVKELAFDLVEAEAAQKRGLFQECAQTWANLERRSCSKCYAETVMHSGVVACFACNTPF